MTMDKTAYAIDNNIGGMMIFTATEDIPYREDNSLLRAMKNTMNSRADVNEKQEEKTDEN